MEWIIVKIRFDVVFIKLEGLRIRKVNIIRNFEL